VTAPSLSASSPGLDTYQIVVIALPEAARGPRAVALLARASQLHLDAARKLTHTLPVALPRALPREICVKGCAELALAGITCEAQACGTLLRCESHPTHVRHESCGTCGAELCVLCRLEAGKLAECRPCARRRARSRRFYAIRVGVLLAVLGGVLIYAAKDYSARHQRRSWRRPLEIALILLERGEVDPDALARFEARVSELELTLARQFARYGGKLTPIHFRRFGPVPQRGPPPLAAGDPGPFEPLRLSFALWRFARDSDAAAGLTASFDGKIYVLLSEPKSERQALVEGLGEEGGRIAVTSIELSEDSVDFGLFVVTHEMLHLLGATDRYGPDGNAVLPDGLGEPELRPTYPQPGAEVMARGRVISPGQEVPPGHLDELRVGHKTATEIGWVAE
jgi:hypothetical protein